MGANIKRFLGLYSVIGKCVRNNVVHESTFSPVNFIKSKYRSSIPDENWTSKLKYPNKKCSGFQKFQGYFMVWFTCKKISPGRERIATGAGAVCNTAGHCARRSLQERPTINLMSIFKLNGSEQTRGWMLYLACARCFKFHSFWLHCNQRK